MRIAITGASGYLGKQLVPIFLDRKVDLLLIGRNPNMLRANFPNCDAKSYNDMHQSIFGFDTVLHLAVLNNDKLGTLDVYRQVNTDLAVEVCNIAKVSRVRRFIFVSSTHALDEGNLSHYAQSKREAVESLIKIEGIQIHILYLPAVTGEVLAGRLAILNGLPRLPRRLAIKFVSYIKPTISIDAVAEAILSGVSAGHGPILAQTVG